MDQDEVILHFYKNRLKTILESDVNQKEKDFQLEILMHMMEKEYKIPRIRSIEWDKNNSEIMFLYRTIVNSKGGE